MVIDWFCLTCVIPVRRDVLVPLLIRGSMQRRPVHNASQLDGRRILLTIKCLFNGSTCILSLMEISLVTNWVCLTCIIPVWSDVLAPFFIGGSMQRRPVHNASKLEPFIHCFTILHTTFRRRKLFVGKHFFTIMIIVAIRFIQHVIFEGMRIGEAALPGPRLRRRGPRSLESGAARRNREGPASDIQESNAENCENGLIMLHLNLRCYLSHIAETTAILRGMEQKPFLVTLNETFLNKAIENVEL